MAQNEEKTQQEFNRVFHYDFLRVHEYSLKILDEKIHLLILV